MQDTRWATTGKLETTMRDTWTKIGVPTKLGALTLTAATASIIGGSQGGAWIPGAMVGVGACLMAVAWLYWAVLITRLFVAVLVLGFTGATGQFYATAVNVYDPVAAGGVVIIWLTGAGLVCWRWAKWSPFRAWLVVAVAGSLTTIVLVSLAPPLGLNAARIGFTTLVVVVCLPKWWKKNPPVPASTPIPIVVNQ